LGYRASALDLRLFTALDNAGPRHYTASPSLGRDEWIHTGLVHDDVVMSQKSGAECHSSYSLWQQIAVLAGDFPVAQSLGT